MNNLFKFYLPKNERFLCSVFFTLFFLDWVAKLFQNTWLHNFVDAPFYYVGTDFSYWLFILSGVPKFILSANLIAYSFDILLTLFTIINIIKPKRLTIALWLLLYFVWVMTTNSVIGSHFHSYNGFIIMGICFAFFQTKYFGTAWEMARYYVMYLFVSAAFWKILRGVPFEKYHLRNLLLQLNVWHAEREHWYARVFKLFTSNLWLSYLCMQAVIALQLFFIIGFISKKYDKWLLYLFVFFCIADYIVFRHFFFELLILCLPFLYPSKNKMESIS